jgi:DNA polymerase III epsilon subunit family exonuclease
VRVALDLETTGLNVDADNIIEIGAVKFAGDEVLDRFETFVAPGGSLPYRIQRLTGIAPAQLRRAPALSAVYASVRAFVGDAPLVGHNISFDASFLRRVGLAARNPLLDTYELASMLLPSLASYTLASVGAALNLESDGHHRALADADLARRVFLGLLERLRDLDTSTLEALSQLAAPPDWTPGYLVRGELRGRRGPPSRGGFGTGLTTSLGDQLASKLRVHPSVLALAGLAAAGAAVAVAPDTMPSETASDNGASNGDAGATAKQRREAIAARLDPALAEGGALLLEIEHDRKALIACLEPALRWAAAGGGERVLVAVADGEALRRVARELVPAALARAGLRSEAVGVAELGERESYLCLWRWFGLARADSGAPLARDTTRGLTKLMLWARETPTGMRADVAIVGQELAAWDRVRAGREFADSAASCPYGSGGYCFLTRAQTAAGTARVVVTTHAALALLLAGVDDLVPSATRLLVLDAHLLEEELRRVRGFTLDQGQVLELLRSLAETDDTGRRSGLLHLAAAHLDSSGRSEQQRSRERPWFEQVARAKRCAHAFYAALGAVILQTRADPDRRQASDGHEQRTLRVDDELRAARSWQDASRAWDALARELTGVAKLLRDLARDAKAADQRLPGSGSGLPIDLLGLARRLDTTIARGMVVFAASGDANIVHWLRVPYPTGDRLPRAADARSARATGGPRSSQARRPATHTTPHAAADAEPPPADVAAPPAPPDADRQSEPPADDIPVVYSAPVRVGDLLAPFRGEGHSLVLASPALAVAGDFDFARAAFGLPATTPGASLAADRAEQTLLGLPDDVPEPNLPYFQRSLEEALVRLATTLGGRVVALFPSHAALRASYQGIRRALEQRDILVLAQGQDGSARQLWHTFAAEPRVVLLGAGSFWDGALRHERAPTCVVVTRLPFPALSDPLLAARAEQWDDQQSQFVVPHAALKLRQALAGLAWGHSRRNAVVLFDRRAQTRGYGPAILSTLPRCAQHQEPMVALAERIATWVGPEGG